MIKVASAGTRSVRGAMAARVRRRRNTAAIVPALITDAAIESALFTDVASWLLISVYVVASKQPGRLVARDDDRLITRHCNILLRARNECSTVLRRGTVRILRTVPAWMAFWLPWLSIFGEASDLDDSSMSRWSMYYSTWKEWGC